MKTATEIIEICRQFAQEDTNQDKLSSAYFRGRREALVDLLRRIDPEAGSLKVANVINFLLARGWQVARETARFRKLKPPPTLDTKAGFMITLPLHDNSTAEPMLRGVTETIAVLHGLSVDEFMAYFLPRTEKP